MTSADKARSLLLAQKEFAALNALLSTEWQFARRILADFTAHKGKSRRFIGTNQLHQGGYSWQH